MITLSAKIRKDVKKEVKSLREKGLIPAVLYGPKLKNLNLEIDLKEFEKVHKEAGESSLISLNVKGQKEKFLVLIHETQYDPLTDKPIHIDFYQPALKEEVEVTVPLILKGESPAIKNFGGTLIKNISEIEVKALPQDLPKEIKVNIEGLENIDDNILVRDLELPKGVKVQRGLKEILVSVSPPEKIEEELEKPIEEKVEEVERVEEPSSTPAPAKAMPDKKAAGGKERKEKASH